jgi:S1-C subfamily serine protease
VGNYDLPLGGDVITAINGETVTSYEDLTVYLETETSVGDTVQLTAFIDGAERTLEVTLEERPGA